MNNVRRIEEFLKLIAGAAMDGYHIDTHNVYANLIYLGVDKKGRDISSNFDIWIERFRDYKNINVFVDENREYFCQFINPNYGRSYGYSMIKLYIPIDALHITESAIQLFDFITEENMPHISKIGKRVRFDDIVVRVNTPENANKIIDFVSNNYNLMNGSLPSNPFAVNCGNVSIAWDGDLSYNEVVSNWISQYINWEKENNNLDNVSYSRFYAFVEKKSKLLFEDGQGLQQFAEELLFEGVFGELYDSIADMLLLNYQDITKLLLLSLEPRAKKEDVFGYVERVTSNSYQNDELDRLHNLRNKSKTYEAVITDEISYTEQQKSAMVLAFKYMYEKYGYNNTRKLFIDFISDGDYIHITRYKGARGLLKDNGITKEIAFKISEEWLSKNMDIEETIDLALNDTRDKYGDYQFSTAIEYIFKYGNFSYITNRNGYRVKLKKVITNDMKTGNLMFVVMEILTRNGYEIDNFDVDKLCDMYVNKINKDYGKNRR